MGFLDFWRAPDMNRGVEEYQNAKGAAVLLDVRSPEEYAEGHVPGSKNLPLQNLDEIGSVVARKDAKLFVYCHSGVRSNRAVALLRGMGYTHASDIGGIATYRGHMER